jgi:hypothetical protein
LIKNSAREKTLTAWWISVLNTTAIVQTLM